MSAHIGVDIAPDVLESFHTQISTIVTKHRTMEFKVALVKQDRFYDHPACPHCNSTIVPQYLTSFNEDHGTCVGDIVGCSICTNMTIALKYPILPVKHPIMLDWKIKP